MCLDRHLAGQGGVVHRDGRFKCSYRERRKDTEKQNLHRRVWMLMATEDGWQLNKHMHAPKLASTSALIALNTKERG